MTRWGYNEKPPVNQGTKNGVQQLASWLICIGMMGWGIYFLFKHALWALLPFLLAYLLAACLRPLVDGITRHSPCPRGLVAAVLVILPVGGLLFSAVWGLQRAVTELESLLLAMDGDQNGLSTVTEAIQHGLQALATRLPFLSQLGHLAPSEQWDDMVCQAAKQVLTSLGTHASKALWSMVSRTPSAILFMAVLLLSCYYFTADNKSIGQVPRRLLTSRLPPADRERLSQLYHLGREVIHRYLRAYALLGGLTFVQMLIGLTFLRMPYAFLMAAVIASADVLPLLGTGTVLIPWAVIRWLSGDPRQGIGLLILWGISILIHHLAEPKLLSASLGIHPVLSLFSMYVGFHFFGVGGMLLGPLFATLLVTGARIFFSSPHNSEKSIDPS